MDQQDLVKASAEGMMKPIADLIDKLAGPAAEEIGLTIRDSVRVWRAKRQLKLLQKVEHMLDEARISPRAVSLKVLLPLMDYASVEDDEDLHTAWAALLANAANPEAAMQITTVFPEILRQISKAEAVFLNAVYDVVVNQLSQDFPPGLWLARMAEHVNLGGWSELVMIYAGAGLTRNEGMALITHHREDPPGSEADFLGFHIALDNLLRLRLLSREMSVRVRQRWDDVGVVDKEDHYLMTPLGFEFVKACRPPEPK